MEHDYGGWEDDVPLEKMLICFLFQPLIFQVVPKHPPKHPAHHPYLLSSKVSASLPVAGYEWHGVYLRAWGTSNKLTPVLFIERI